MLARILPALVLLLGCSEMVRTTPDALKEGNFVRLTLDDSTLVEGKIGRMEEDKLILRDFTFLKKGERPPIVNFFTLPVEKGRIQVVDLRRTKPAGVVGGVVGFLVVVGVVIAIVLKKSKRKEEF